MRRRRCTGCVGALRSAARAALLEIRLSEARESLVDPGGVEDRQVKIDWCADPVTEMRVIGEIIVRQRVYQRSEAGVAHDVLDREARALP